MAQLVLDNKADVDKADEEDVTPLYEAVQNNNIQMVQLLLDYKANIHKANNAALYLAAKEGKTQIVELLIGNVGSLAN